MKEARTRAPRGFKLTTRAKFERRSQHSEATSANVVGMLPGSDPCVEQ